MRVIGFTGYAQSGKDTAAGFLVERGWTRLAFADILRLSLYNLNPLVVGHFRVQDVVNLYGWDVAKVDFPEIRQLLQRFGTEVGRELYGETFWVDRVLKQLTPDGNFVITDVRFPNEADAVRDIGGSLFRIARPGVQAANGHASEDIGKLRVDLVIPNTGDLDHFRAVVLEAVDRN